MGFKGGKVYLFGSILQGKPCISDIDILVVYDSEDGLSELKNKFLNLGLNVPIDLIYMTSNEERYLNFVVRENAKQMPLSDQYFRSICRFIDSKSTYPINRSI